MGVGKNKLKENSKMAQSLEMQTRVPSVLEMDSMAIRRSYKVSTRAMKRSIRHVGRKINSRIRATSICSRRKISGAAKKIARKINSRVRMTSINSRAMIGIKAVGRKINARIRMTSISSRVKV